MADAQRARVASAIAEALRSLQGRSTLERYAGRTARGRGSALPPV